MEKVRLSPIEGQDRRDFQVRCPRAEEFAFQEHAVSEPQPPKYEQPSLFDF